MPRDEEHEHTRTGRSTMTVRVSRDSGRTWEAQIQYLLGAADLPNPVLWDSVSSYPACRCPRCRPDQPGA